ncbi:MAG: DUF6056 family protein [Flavobacterium sp.]
MIKKFKAIFTRSLLHNATLFIVLAILILIPFVLISVYNNPASDDFDFSYRTKIYSVLEVQIWRFNHEGGRCFSNGLLSVNPLYFNNYWLFKVIPVLVIALFVGSLHFFFSKVLERFSRSKKWAVIGLIVYLYLFQIPEICSAFYWTTGAVTYQLSISLVLFFLGFLHLFATKKKVVDLFCSLFFLILALGCNEIVIVFLLVIGSFVLSYRYYQYRKIDGFLVFLFAGALVISVFELTAPGNHVRSMTIPIKHLVLRSIVQTFLHCIYYSLKWTPIILLSCLFFINEINDYISQLKSRRFFMNPVWSFGLLILSFYACMFIGFWSINQILPNRVLNVIYFFYICMTLYCVIGLVSYVEKKYAITTTLDSRIRALLGAILVILAFSDTPTFNAYHDLLTGRASRYDKSINERFTLLKNTPQKKICVPALLDKPPTLYNEIIMGLTTDKNNWKNLELSLYYNKEITIQPSDSTLVE